MSDPFLASYVALWLVVAASLVVLLATARQVALLTRRFPFAQVVREQGPELGEEAPAVTGTKLSGEAISIAAPVPAPTGFVFLTEGCTTCKERIPDLEQLAEQADAFDLWLVSERAPEDEAFLTGPLTERLIVSDTAFQAWKVVSVPYGFVVGTSGKVEAKGDLLNIGRLRAGLGLDPDTAADPVPEGAVA